MDPTTNPVYLLFAMFLPLIIAMFKQVHFPDNVNALIALCVYLAVGLVGAIATTGGVPNVATIIPFVTTVTVVGSAAYHLFWSQIGGQDNSFDNMVTETTTFTQKLLGASAPAPAQGS